MVRLYVAACVACAACAQAGAPTSGPVDAPHGIVDSSKAVDARPLDAAMTTSCTGATTCQSAMDLGSVSGDTGAAIVMGSGYQSGWYKVRVTEDDSGVFGVQMTATFTLTSPASAKYSLHVYINTGSDVVECAASGGTVTTTGNTDSIRLAWGESGTFSNGTDDSRTVSIEVRAPATGCSAASPFQLQVQGDT